QGIERKTRTSPGTSRSDRSPNSSTRAIYRHEQRRFAMNQVADKNATNGKGQPEQLLPASVVGEEGSKPPSPEAKKPFVPDKKKTSGRDYWKAILVGAVIVAIILAVSLIPKSRLKTSSGQAAKDQQKTDSSYGSTTPVNQIGNNSDQQPDGSKIGPGV